MFEIEVKYVQHGIYPHRPITSHIMLTLLYKMNYPFACYFWNLTSLEIQFAFVEKFHTAAKSDQMTIHKSFKLNYSVILREFYELTVYE